MRENWREILNNWLLRCVPLVVSILWLLLSFMPLKSEISANARPVVGLMCVYFWAIYRPDLFNLWSVFILGAVSDMLSVAPMGINLFMYLLTYTAVVNLIRYVNDKTFEILWAGIALLLPAVLLAGWFLMSVYYAEFLPVKSLFFSYMLSVVAYPLIGGINAVVVNRFLQEEN